MGEEEEGWGGSEDEEMKMRFRFLEGGRLMISGLEEQVSIEE